MAGAWLAAAMVMMGVVATIFAIRQNFVPKLFPPSLFLVMNILGILIFGGLVAAGISLRRRLEWHRGLMLCATVSMLTPGLARLFPVGAIGAFAPLLVFGTAILFCVAGMIADKATLGRIHPAYLWGTGVIVLSDMLIVPLAATAPVAAALRLTAAA